MAFCIFASLSWFDVAAKSGPSIKLHFVSHVFLPIQKSNALNSINQKLKLNHHKARLHHLKKKKLGPVVRNPINANPRLKVNRGFHHGR